MSKLGVFLKLGAVVVVVAAVGVLIGWLGSRGGMGTTPPNPPDASLVSQQSKGSSGQTGPRSNSSAPSRSSTNVPGNAAAATPLILTNWEDRVDNILGSDGEESGKARAMLAIFHQLPPDGQVEVAQHLSNLVLDEDYAPLGALLTDTALPADVLDVLMGDLLNRPNSLKLPLLLDVARNDQHPKSAEAKDILELFLEEDYGNDWNQWQAKMQEWLQANPD